MSIPDDCLQTLVDPWWVEDDGRRPCRGRLLRVNIPHVMAEQATLKVSGRDSATDHRHAQYEIAKPFRMSEFRAASRLPLAGLPNLEGEVYLVQRAKVRPAIIIATELEPLPRKLRVGTTKRWTNPTMLVAPAYGASPEGRSTPPAGLLTRFRHCEYPNYMWNMLPGAKGPSIIRLDQIQPIGFDRNCYDLTRHKLSDEALELLDDWLHWLFSGEFGDDSILEDVREELLKM